MKKLVVIGAVLCAALSLSACAIRGGFGCNSDDCVGGAGVNVGPVGGSIGGVVDRNGVHGRGSVHVRDQGVRN